MLRLKKKAHLIKARMAGASVARGDVLYFQDGHTEVLKYLKITDATTKIPRSIHLVTSPQVMRAVAI